MIEEKNFTDKVNNKKGFDKIVITNALIYANGPAHIGHMLEYVQADTISRALKIIGHEVVFCGAEDTHGTPIEIKALQLGLKPEELIKRMEELHLKDFKDYSIKYDSYYTTNSPENRLLAESIFLKLKEKNLIYKKSIELTYCEYDKRFLPDRYIKGVCPKCGAEDQYGDQCEKCGTVYSPVDLIKPYCILCKNSPIRKNSEHYFFRLSEFSEKLRMWLNTNKELQPEIRNQVLSWIDKGLEDWCISRDGPYFGFKIPGEYNKYFYVWLDAPMGYISSLCYNKGSIEEGLRYWNNSRVIHIIGKDIIYFHLLFWPAVLMAADIKLPEMVLVHGFLNVNNEKMSKSRGTFLNAIELSSIINPEYFRYYIVSNLSRTMSDVNLDLEDFKERINNELIGNIANFVYRVLSFTNKNFNSKVTSELDLNIINESKKIALETLQFYERYELRSASQSISKLSALGNKYFQEREPWKLLKNNNIEAQKIVNTAINILKNLIIVLKPVLPNYCEKIEEQLNLRNLTSKDIDLDIINHNINNSKIIFEKIDKLSFSKNVIDNNGDKSDKLEINNVLSKDQKKNVILKDESVNVNGRKILKENNDDISSFYNLQLRVAIIRKVSKHPNAEKLYIEEIDFGDEIRTIVSGLVPYYKEEELLGKKIVVVSNLEPAIIRGVKSEGMLLAAENNDGVGLVLSTSNIGEYVFTDEIDIDKIAKLNSLNKISIKEFSKIKFFAKDGKAYLNDKELKVNGGTIFIDKISNGIIH